mmetsp:Transcript_29432/g.70767  ORF Transcript_29432/g.70767 Transcript_29432/m.70767 type:complete len:523 (-) Transcript_29432:524-2092(-)
MSVEYQGGIEVELTSHNGPIVSRTMPQDFEFRGTGDGDSARHSMHQHRRSYDGSMSTAIPVKRLMSFGGVDSDSMVGATSEVSAVWDAPPSGIEKENEAENEALRFLQSYAMGPAPAPSSSNQSLKSRDDLDERSTYSHSEMDDDASDISSSVMGSMRRRNRISQNHVDQLQKRQQQNNLEKKKKKPLGAKTSINEVKPKSSYLKPAPRNVSFRGKSQASKSSISSFESKLRKVTPARTAALFRDTDSSSASVSTEEISRGPLAPTAKRSIGEGKYFKFDETSNSSIVASSVNSGSPDRSVATNWTNLTYSTGGSGRVYRTQIKCSGKYKGRVMSKVVTLNPDDLQIGRILEGLENGFVDQEDFAHALINNLFDYEFKKEPLHRLKQWEIANVTLSRLGEENEKTTTETGKAKEAESTSDTTMATTVSEESARGEPVDIISPPATKRIIKPAFNVAAKPPLSPKEGGDARFVAEKTASLHFNDVFGMASAKGIIHFYEDRDEIWIEDYDFCFASRRFKFLSG